MLFRETSTCLPVAGPVSPLARAGALACARTRRRSLAKVRWKECVVLSGELVRIEDGLIRSITLIFDWRRWPEVLRGVARRAAAPAEANR